MDSTSKSRELPPINEVEETPILPPSPAASCYAPVSVHSQMNVASAGHPAQGIVRPELGKKGPFVPQSSGGNVSVQNLVSNDNMNPRLEKIFGRPFPTIVSQPNPSMLGSLPTGMVDITEEMRREEEKLRKLLFYEGEGPISKSLHGNPKTVSNPILTESGSTSSTGQSTAEACKAIRKEFNEFMVSMGKRPTLTSTTESCIDLVTSSSLSMSPPVAHVSTKSVIFSSAVSVAEAPSNGGNGGHFSQISHSVNPPPPQQTFATAVWKPKEPPCFFGRSTEDAHTWVSLVRNYLTFMSSSDSQQVAYTATLF